MLYLLLDFLNLLDRFIFDLFRNHAPFVALEELLAFRLVLFLLLLVRISPLVHLSFFLFLRDLRSYLLRRVADLLMLLLVEHFVVLLLRLKRA